VTLGNIDGVTLGAVEGVAFGTVDDGTADNK
jgi:hypothetical protein